MIRQLLIIFLYLASTSSCDSKKDLKVDPSQEVHLESSKEPSKTSEEQEEQICESNSSMEKCQIPSEKTKNSQQNNPAHKTMLDAKDPLSSSSMTNNSFGKQKTVLSGTIVSPRSGSISFQTTGVISQIHKKVGQALKKGDILASLDDTIASLELKSKEESKRIAEIELGQAQRDFEREKKLKNQNATSIASYEKFKKDSDLAQMRFEQSKTQVELYSKYLYDTKLRAPFDGTIVSKFKNEGEYVSPQTPVFEFTETTGLEIHFQIPEVLFSKIKIGDIVPITIVSQDLRGQAEVVRVVSVVNDKTRTFTVIAIPKISGKFGPGQFVEAEF